ncbi:MAG: hypothetical protein JJU27_11690, partial [Gammaproteobacteria bacterium]|nr:hypothetical protein [Gammaproteobacteria bacterium]
MNGFSIVTAVLMAWMLSGCAFAPAAESGAAGGHPATAQGASIPMPRPMSLVAEDDHDHSQHDHSQHDHSQHDH